MGDGGIRNWPRAKDPPKREPNRQRQTNKKMNEDKRKKRYKVSILY